MWGRGSWPGGHLGVIVGCLPEAGRRARFVAVVSAVVAVSFLLSDPVRSGAVSVPSQVGSDRLTLSQLARDLRDGARVSAVPVNLQPPLAYARWVRPAVSTNGCEVGRRAVWHKPCIYGDTASHISVVVFGDSHAAMWFPALDLISKQQHWRLIDLTKVGCPSVDVSTAAWFLGGRLYSACSKWRVRAMSRIASLHPALVIVTWARWLEELEARPSPGVPSGYGSPWLDGVAGTFRFLRRVARRVIFISDIPTLRQPAWLCLKAHRFDMQACTVTPSAGVRLPTVKAGELALARREGVTSIDPTAWFCTPMRCPVIVGNILVYDDNSHMTPQWARFIAPILARSILRAMRWA